MPDFDMDRCTAYSLKLVEQRCPSTKDRLHMHDLQISIGLSFANEGSPSVDPEDPMLPMALRLLADSLEHEQELVALGVKAITQRAGSLWE